MSGFLYLPIFILRYFLVDLDRLYVLEWHHDNGVISRDIFFEFLVSSDSSPRTMVSQITRGCLILNQRDIVYRGKMHLKHVCLLVQVWAFFDHSILPTCTVWKCMIQSVSNPSLNPLKSKSRSSGFTKANKHVFFQLLQKCIKIFVFSRIQGIRQARVQES